MNVRTLLTLLAVMALGAPAVAQLRQQQSPQQRLGDHPAEIVKRQGYDYAAKFYPHPAWLYLYPAPPDEMATQLTRDRREREEPPATRTVVQRGH